MYLISDNTDTLTGMRLAGVEGILVRSRDQVKKLWRTQSLIRTTGSSC